MKLKYKKFIEILVYLLVIIPYYSFFWSAIFLKFRLLVIILAAGQLLLVGIIPGILFLISYIKTGNHIKYWMYDD